MKLRSAVRTQPKLRVLQEREIERPGGSERSRKCQSHLPPPPTVICGKWRRSPVSQRSFYRLVSSTGLPAAAAALVPEDLSFSKAFHAKMARHMRGVNRSTLTPSRPRPTPVDVVGLAGQRARAGKRD